MNSWFFNFYQKGLKWATMDTLEEIGVAKYQKDSEALAPPECGMSIGQQKTTMSAAQDKDKPTS